MKRAASFPGRARRNRFIPWYGCVNMETDRPPVTSCGNTGLARNFLPSNREQDKLWEARIWVTLDFSGCAGTVSARHYSPGLGGRIAALLGHPIRLKVLN